MNSSATQKAGSLTEDPALLCLRRAVPAPDGLSGHARRTCQGLRAVCHRRRRFIAAGRARYARVRSTTNVANTMTMTGGISISIAAPMHAGCRATIQGRTPAGRGAQELRRGPVLQERPRRGSTLRLAQGPRSNRRETAQPGPIMPPYGLGTSPGSDTNWAGAIRSGQEVGLHRTCQMSGVGGRPLRSPARLLGREETGP